jgi:hypothetical protein
MSQHAMSQLAISLESRGLKSIRSIGLHLLRVAEDDGFAGYVDEKFLEESS